MVIVVRKDRNDSTFPGHWLHSNVYIAQRADDSFAGTVTILNSAEYLHSRTKTSCVVNPNVGLELNLTNVDDLRDFVAFFNKVATLFM